MNKLIVFLLLCTMAIPVFGQDKAQKKVADAVEQLRVAMVEGDRTKLEKIVDDQLSYGHSGGKLENKQEFVENIVSGKSDFVTIDLKEQTIQVSGNTAIVRHILSAKTNDNGKPGEVNLRIMLVFKKMKGGWKLLARQAVKIV